MNNKGATFSGWAEAIMFGAVFMVLFGVVIAGMNTLYSQNQDTSGGLDRDGESFIDDFTELEKNLDTQIEEGEATFGDDSGLSLSTIWVVLKVTWQTTGNVLTGGWIESIAENAQLPSIFAKVLRVLFIISIAFLLVKLLLKVKP